MENVKIKLDTDTKYGNSSGMQIDTLSVAVCGRDYNEIWLDSHDYLSQYDEYALDDYDYEADFVASLSPEQATGYIDNAEGYKEALAMFTHNLRDRAVCDELDAKHPLAIAFQEARDRGERALISEWLHGDRSEAGLLVDAGRKYSVEFHYDEKKDTLTFDIDEGEVSDLVEYQGVKNTKKEIGEYFANIIEVNAYEKTEKRREQSAKNKENYETRKRIQAEQEAKKEAARVERLKAIIKKV